MIDAVVAVEDERPPLLEAPRPIEEHNLLKKRRTIRFAE
jgi:hypothetical protein